MFKNLFRRTPSSILKATESIDATREAVPSGPPKQAARVHQARLEFHFPNDHGHQIYTYVNVRTRQTIYSLSRNLTPEHLKQLMFVGKKSVPPTIRKDMWTPLCVLNFPNRFQGLHAYARLKEFKVRHETEWDIDEFTWKVGPNAGQRMGSREAGKRRRSNVKMFKLMDQKANSIASMAAVLEMQARPPLVKDVQKQQRLVDKFLYLHKKEEMKDGSSPVVLRERAKRGVGSKIGHRVFEFQGKIQGTSIWWQDPHDAGFAAEWPEEVVHGQLVVNRSRGLDWPPIARLNIDVPEGTEKEQEEVIARAIEEHRLRVNVEDETASVEEPRTQGEPPKRTNIVEARRRKMSATMEKIANARRRMVDENGELVLALEKDMKVIQDTAEA